ncbi:metallophosphoesterase [Jatrophihabitans sp. YIM 134969]
MPELPDHRYRILHLSDTHVGADGFDEDGVAARAALEGLMADLAHVPDIDLVLVSGDVADDGSEGGCGQVRDVVGRFARERNVPHVYSTGNHDRRPGFTAALGSGHLSPTGSDISTDRITGGECAAVSVLGGLRVVTLDSLVDGETHGVLSTGQLAWLADVLATASDDARSSRSTTRRSTCRAHRCSESCCRTSTRSPTSCAGPTSARC